MMHANNPICHGDVNGERDYIELYGCDPEGPSPSEQDNSIVVKPVTLDNTQSEEFYVLDVVDPQMDNGSGK